MQEAMHTFTVPDDDQKRLDAFLSANMQETSRARLQSIIKEGFVAVNGKPASKAGQGIRTGDTITCEVPPLAPIVAAPEVSLLIDKHLFPHGKSYCCRSLCCMHAPRTPGAGS
jgi:ribosomal 50S subunit-recycling heat shock protein